MYRHSSSCTNEKKQIVHPVCSAFGPETIAIEINVNLLKSSCTKENYKFMFTVLIQFGCFNCPISL